MANRLANETSPYLRQHADNPVDWYPWGAEALESAAARDVPVLLSVGYSACHWCHVMAHESFEDPDTAAVMNRDFVNVKVDREERPDIDAVYMEATQAMTGRGGWPMTVFMAPDGRPFFCGTYFPKEPRAGQPTFTQLLEAVADAWRNRREELLGQADQLTEVIRRQTVAATGDSPGGTEVLDEATMGILAAFDAQWGGFGRAPKFPQTMAVDHLLRHHRRTGSAAPLEAAVLTLDTMAAGGIHDHLGGGFSRYSVDERWLVPHFEKMLYDNALLVRPYLHAWQLTGESRHLDVVAATIDYVLRDLSHPDGGRYSAQDADSLPSAGADHAEEGAYYVWTPDQVRSTLEAAGLAEHADDTLAWFGVTAAGNFEGASIPNRLHARGQLERPPEIRACAEALLAARGERPAPGLDDKVLTEWNALWLAAAAEAGAAADRADWVAAAERTAEFLCGHLRRPATGDGPARWLRSWQAGAAGGADGGARHLAYAADHAALLDAFVTLYEATGRLRWLEEARSTATDLLGLFWDPQGSLWSTGSDAEDLVARPKDLMDNATPSANSMAAVGLLRLEAHTGDEDWGDHARRILDTLGATAARHPLGFANLLLALEIAALGATEVVVTGDRPDLVAAVQQRFTPTAVLAWGEQGSGPLWEGRDAEGADGVAYVCRAHACRAPSDDADSLVAELDAV